MSRDGVAGAGPLGGSADEHGAEVRAGVAAWFMAHAATGRPVPGLDLGDEAAVPVQVRVEVDEAIDDLEVLFIDANRALVQSKARLRLEKSSTSPFGKAVAQWRAQAEEGFDDGDRLVLVTSDASREVKALAAALDRRRDQLAGRPSRRERRAMEVLLDHLRVLEPTLRGRLLDHASILVLDLDTDGVGDAGVAAELLDSRVVGPGEGRTAFRALRARFRQCAVVRSGVDVDRMIDLLREDRLRLIIDAHASVAARRLAAGEALERLRKAQVKAASEVDLRQLGIVAPHMPAVELGQHPGVRLGTEPSSRLGAVRALRRRSRMLLVGPTGSGKTVLLRQLTVAAATDGATGVFVPLSRTVEVGLEGDPLEVLVRAALADVPADDRDLIAEEIRRVATEGPMVAALDGLDETRTRRFDVVSWVSRLIERLHPDAHVVVATRSSAYAAASTLGFHEVTVAPLDRPEVVATPVLEALSPDVPTADRQSWVDERLGWVKDAVRQTNVGSTPLAVTLLSVLAAQRAHGGLPTGRAKLVDDLLDRIARSWERRTDRAADLSGGLTANEITEALMGAFAIIGWQVATSARPAIDSLVACISEATVEGWQVAPRRAEVFAREALHFWDEAGIVSISDDGTAVTAGLRVVVELGAGRFVAAAQIKAPLIDVLLADETLHEIAVLAAGLSADAARVTVDRAIALGTRPCLLAAARGSAEGTPSPDVVERLVATLLAAPGEGHDLVQTCRVVASLAVPPAEQSAVVARLTELLPATEGKILCALAMARWRMEGGIEAIESVLQAGRPPREAGAGRLALVDVRPIAEAYGDVLIEAAQRLDLGRPEVVNLLEAAAGEAPLRLAQRVDGITRARGVVLRPPEGLSRIDWASLARAQQAVNQAFVAFLDLLASLAPPRPLSWGERRRLDGLARLFGVLLVSESHPRDLDVAMDSAVEDLGHLIHAVLDATSLDTAAIAAEATVALSEIHSGASIAEMSLLLMDSVGPPPAVDWDCLDADLLLHLVGSTRWIGLVAASLLLRAPVDDRAALADRVAAAAEQLGAWHRRLAGEVAMQLDPSSATVASWAHSEDSLLRSVAAGAAAECLDIDVLDQLLRDRDATVRHGGLFHIDPHKLGSEDRLCVLVAAAGAEQFDERTCRWCGNVNPREGNPNCSQCGLALPDVRNASAALLAGRSPSW